MKLSSMQPIGSKGSGMRCLARHALEPFEGQWVRIDLHATARTADIRLVKYFAGATYRFGAAQ